MAWKAFEVASGGDKMEYFFAAALAIVIVGALVITIYFTFFKSNTAAVGPGENMWQCQKCNTAISVDLATQQRLEEMDRPAIECPKCGSVQPVWPMVRCFNPACRKYFVRQSVINRRRPSSEDTCPYCGKNWMKTLEEQARSGRTK
ncbi:MAG: hypothetical protein MUP47_03950 [Phycisphaerae bacterium]|nr:hypothetical protein [Phycisphaerae bacterium]